MGGGGHARPEVIVEAPSKPVAYAVREVHGAYDTMAFAEFYKL